MYHHILCATDLNPSAKETIRRAWEMSNQFDTKLSLVHVIEPIPAYGYPGSDEFESPRIDRAKQALMAMGKEFGVAEDDLHLVVGPTKIEILELAKKLDVNLIIVGSHGRHGLSRLLGSTANAVINGAECDVLTIRPVV